MSVPPYGPAMAEAIARGDLEEMREVQRLAEDHLRETGNVSQALELLRVEIAKLEFAGRGRRLEGE